MDWFSFAMLFRAARNALAVAFVLGMLLAPGATTAVFTVFAMQQIEHKAELVNRTLTPTVNNAIEGLAPAPEK